MATLKYTTTQQFAAVLNSVKNIPDWDVGNTPIFEVIGTGNGVQSIFYIDHRNIISGSYLIYYGATQAAAALLTETTHYTVDIDKGKLTLTGAGVTLVALNNIYGEYSYITNGMSDSYLNTTLSRAEQLVDDVTHTSFTNGTVTNPAYPSKSTEYKASQGLYNKNYYTEKHSVIDVVSALSADMTIGAVTLSLTAGTGKNYPTSGTLLVGSEIIKYTGISTDSVTGLTRGYLSSTASTHKSGDSVHTTSCQISGTDEGGVPVWYTLSYDSEFVVGDMGKIYIYGDTVYSNIIIGNNLLYKQDIPNRLRINYLYGWNTIPTDITRLALLFAQRSLWSDNIMSSVIKGRNEFRPEIQEVIQKEIDLLVGVYEDIDIGNT